MQSIKYQLIFLCSKKLSWFVQIRNNHQRCLPNRPRRPWAFSCKMWYGEDFWKGLDNLSTTRGWIRGLLQKQITNMGLVISIENIGFVWIEFTVCQPVDWMCWELILKLLKTRKHTHCTSHFPLVVKARITLFMLVTTQVKQINMLLVCLQWFYIWKHHISCAWNFQLYEWLHFHITNSQVKISEELRFTQAIKAIFIQIITIILYLLIFRSK